MPRWGLTWGFRMNENHMAHIDVHGVWYRLPTGRVLLRDVSFRVADGQKVAIVGANGTGKSTLLRMLSGSAGPGLGTIVCDGTLAVLPQWVGMSTGVDTVWQLLARLLPEPLQATALRLHDADATAQHDTGDAAQLAFVDALNAWGDAGGYDQDIAWEQACTAVLGVGFEQIARTPASQLSGGEQKRLALAVLLDSAADMLVLDEPDNALDIAGKEWLEQRVRATRKAVVLISHDRTVIGRVAERYVTLEASPRGSTAWVFSGSYADWYEERIARHERYSERLKQWHDEHQHLKEMVRHIGDMARHNEQMAPRYKAVQHRLEKYEADGPPEAPPLVQHIDMRLQGARTGDMVCDVTDLAIAGVLPPTSLLLTHGERVAVVGGNGSGKSHLLRCIAGTETHSATGQVRLGARVTVGVFAQNHDRTHFHGGTPLALLWKNASLPVVDAMAALRRYGLTEVAEVPFEWLSGGQQARLQILLLEMGGATLLLLDEPTDNLDIESAEALERGLAGYQGTVLCVTHDRWFVQLFDRVVTIGA